jgi:hypothetical protein
MVRRLGEITRLFFDKRCAQSLSVGVSHGAACGQDDGRLPQRAEDHAVRMAVSLVNYWIHG